MELKRFLLIGLMSLSATFAIADKQEPVFTLNQNDYRVAKALEFTHDQDEVMRMFHMNLNSKLESLPVKDEENVIKLLDDELVIPSMWLDKKQFSKYLEMVVSTFKNRGLIGEDKKVNIAQRK